MEATAEASQLLGMRLAPSQLPPSTEVAAVWGGWAGGGHSKRLRQVFSSLMPWLAGTASCFP